MKNKNIFNAFSCSIDGIKVLLIEKSAKRELFLIFFTILYVLIFQPQLIFILLLLVISVLILSLEALNTAIEYTCNEITKKKTKNIKRAKDLGSSSIIILLIVYSFVFLMSIINKIY